MELKKSPKADLQNKKSVFLLTGIVISLCLVISLFSWSKSEKKIDTMAAKSESVEQDVIEVTVQEDKPVQEVPKTPVAVSELLKIVNNDVKITEDITFFDESMIGGDDFKVVTFNKGTTGEDEVADDVPALIADEMPKFKGKDINEFRNWCQSNITYPPMAEENQVSGNVQLEFIVEKDGTVSNVKVVRGVDRELDQAAQKQVQSSPKWTPGMTRGRAVRIRCNIIIKFVLNNR